MITIFTGETLSRNERQKHLLDNDIEVFVEN